MIFLFHLTKIYCAKYQVKHVPSKTKLLVLTNKKIEVQAMTDLAINTISLDGQDISPSSQATHVGVVRFSQGNGPNIAARLTAHRRAVYSVLNFGLAKGHRANPHAYLRVETVYGVSVLLSGLASLVLTSSEEKMIDQSYKVYIQRLLRLHQATPAPGVFLIAGCLPLD